MNKYLLSFSLLVLLSGCGKKADDPAVATDPFLGHWQAQSVRSVKYSPSGAILTDEASVVASQLDITATTITFTSVVNGKTSVEVDKYVRNGESITLTATNGNTNSGGETTFIRSLTASTFDFEFDGRRVAGQTYYIQTIPYRR